ncbi:hypothetical protein GCK32_015786 [Trichostrongylus colubriformis]|uniref:Saposin B-type domain-containing protein n=1 Tax=Trichostrongylus colubriformis TaxID=6319 RepID=A0AAN8IU70_TRICO
MSKAILFAVISALLSTALCEIDCYAFDRFLERIALWSTSLEPCLENLCQNWHKNSLEMKAGKDVEKFCNSMEMC